MIAYLRDPAEITRRSFAIIGEEAGLDRLPPDLGPLIARLIHTCGMPDIVADLAYDARVAAAGRAALQAGAVVLVDCEMVKAGITLSRLPATNPILCTLGEVSAAEAAARGTTRSAAAVERWGERLQGAVVAIGNAPTALFRLIELIAAGAPKPAAICAFPVGFVGAAESKQALIESGLDVPFITLRGRRGGSPLAAAAVNALAGP